MSATKPDITVRARTFAAGYQSGPSADSLSAGGSPEAKNAIFAFLQESPSPRAILQKRPGSTLMDPAAMGAAPVDGLFGAQIAGTADKLLAVCDGKLFEYDPSTPEFSQIGASAPFTSGNPARFAQFRNQVFIVDGSANLRTDLTSLYTMGFAAPTGAPTLTAVAPAGSGVSGTYEGFAVWYDSATGHESSPSTYTAQVALSSQDRRWAKPSGTPPANVTSWRVYCRRVDTGEVKFFLVGTVAVATTSLTEAVSDAARRDPGPAVNINNVAPAFALIGVYKGYGIGVKVNDSSVYVSKLNDLESWNPTDVFLVQRGAAITTSRPYGAEYLLQTDIQTFRLVGDTLPFRIEDQHSSYGNVSQEAGLEVDGLYYAWDREKGPYRTDLTTWTLLADVALSAVISTLDKSQLDSIRAAYHPALNAIVWAVATDSTGRNRTLFCFCTKTGTWLPPMTGLEFASLSTWLDDSGAIGLYAGDYFGRVWRLFYGTTGDGPATGDRSAAITGATATKITCAAATFNTTGAGLAGVLVGVRSPSEAWQFVRVASNTATELTLDSTHGSSLDPLPAVDGTWTVYVGAIEWYWATPLIDGGDPWHKKAPWFFELQAESLELTTTVRVEVRLNGNQGFDQVFTMPLQSGVTGMVWDSGLWGTGVWANPSTNRLVPRKHRLTRAFTQMQAVFRNYFPEQSVSVYGYTVTADVLGGRRSISV